MGRKMKNEFEPTHLPLGLSGGLVLRRAAAADGEALAVFSSRMHSDDGPDRPDQGVYYLLKEIADGKNPALTLGDFTVVEEIASGRIVSCMCLISQTWSYAGIPFKVGRPELVATEPDYRNRGLVHRQFDVIHQWSRERGEIVQGITGIPVYYRQFGYEMALDLDGSRTLFEPHLPRMKDGELEKFTLRAAEERDLPFLMDLYNTNLAGSMITCVRDDTTWKFELSEREPQSCDHCNIYIVQDAAGKPAGWVVTFAQAGKGKLIVRQFDLLPAFDRYLAARAVSNHLWQIGKSEAEKSGNRFAELQFSLGRSHLVYDLLGDALLRPRAPYAWYMRVTDLPAFLNLVRPVLETRFRASAYAGFNGSIKLMPAYQGLEMTFESGKILPISELPALNWGDADALFPGQIFLQLLFGFRDLNELMHAFVDLEVKEPARHLLSALFPVQSSNIWMI